MKANIEKLKWQVYNVSTDEDGEEALFATIADLEEEISSPDSIIEWFQSPFISSYDKKKAFEEIKKMKL